MQLLIRQLYQENIWIVGTKSFHVSTVIDYQRSRYTIGNSNNMQMRRRDARSSIKI